MCRSSVPLPRRRRWFAGEIVPFQLEPSKKFPRELFSSDEGWRGDTTLESWPSFARVQEGRHRDRGQCLTGDAACAIV